MATRFGNSGRGEITPGRPSNLDGDLNREKVTTGQPSNQKETNPGQPPRVEGDAGTINDGPEQTEAKSTNLLELYARLYKPKETFGDDIIQIKKYLGLSNIEIKDGRSLEEQLADLKHFLETAKNIEGTEGLKTIIEIALLYIQLLRKGDNRSQLLANVVVQIAKELKQDIDK